MKKEFKNEHFHELCEFMEKMDKSDDYIMVQVSTLNPGKEDMDLKIVITGREGDKKGVDRIKAEALLLLAMQKDDDFKCIVTDAVMHYELYQAFKRRQS